MESSNEVQVGRLLDSGEHLQRDIKFWQPMSPRGALRGGNTAVIQLYVVSDCEGTSVIWVRFINHLDRLCDLPVVAILTSQ